MEQQKPQVRIPRISVKTYGQAPVVYTEMFLGNLRFRPSEAASKPLNKLLDDNYLEIYFENVCFGPYINFDEISGYDTRSIDDFLVVCKPENKITIYDQTALDNKPRKINFFDPRDKQKPIFFEPKLIINATKKIVKEPKCKSHEQSYVGTAVFDIIDKMGFNEFTNDIGYRFFKPVSKDGKEEKEHPDSSVLFKTGKTSFTWYLIDSAKMSFCAFYFDRLQGYDSYQFNGYSELQNIAEFIKHLKKEKIKRDEYFNQQYGR
jgi:hypothetical protein